MYYQLVNPKREYIVGAGGAALYLAGGATDDWAKVGYMQGLQSELRCEELRGIVRNYAELRRNIGVAIALK